MSALDGGGDRATVALAVAKIDGLHDLTRAEFAEVKGRLTKLEGLPERVAVLESVVNAHEREIARSRASWLVHWPTLLPALAALVVSAVAIFT